MSERPILFSAPMVRTILAGAKTQTRRTIKSMPHLVPALNEMRDCIRDEDGLPSRLDMAPKNWDRSPYGVPGDRLWVRETSARCGNTQLVIYKADAARALGAYGCVRWTPSIHMPRWASRITLEVTDVRVERLQDISEGDARAEGVTFAEDGCARFGVEGLPSSWCDCAATAYAALWESINGAGSWDANPWVWVVTFRKLP